MSEYIIRNLITEILFGKRICESVEDLHFVSVVYETIQGDMLLEKLLVGEPVGIPELRKLLRKKILNFEFIKLDGEIRPARGTTMMKYIPQSDHPKGIRPSSDKVATFYDLDKKAWRSVSNRSKEVVLKYAFGDKEAKKPVFVVKDRDQKVEEPEVEPAEPKEEPEVIDVDIEPAEDDFADDLELDFSDDVEIEDVDAIRKPDVEVVEKKPKYGWRPKVKDEPEEDLPSPGEIEDVIVRPNIGYKPKRFTPKKDEVQILLPQPVGQPLPEPEEAPEDLSSPGPKPPPLTIDEEEPEL